MEWKWKFGGMEIWIRKIWILFLFLLIASFLSCKGLACPSGFTEVLAFSDDQSCVLVNVDTPSLNWREARWDCQDQDPAADFFKVGPGDIQHLPTGINHFVGLTDANIPTAPEWITDCTPFVYNVVYSPVLGTCSSPPCCYTLSIGNELRGVDCVNDVRNHICSIQQPSVFPDIPCPLGWTPVKDQCYQYNVGNNPGVEYDGAATICQAGGGQLAKANFYDCNFAALLGNRPDGNIPYLVGLRDFSGTLRWPDGSEPTVTDFITGSGSCFQLGADTTRGSLEQVSCAGPFAQFICERDTPSDTPTATETNTLSNTPTKEQTAIKTNTLSNTPTTEQTAIKTTIKSATEFAIQLMEILDTLFTSGENITTEEVENAAETVRNISSDVNFLEEDPERVLGLVISFLEYIVSTGEASVEVTEPVVRIINNLMNVDQAILEEGMAQGGIAVAALEKQITNFQMSTGNFSRVLENVGVAAVKIDPQNLGSSLAYANVFPDHTTPTLNGNLRQENSQVFSDGDSIPPERTATSISVPATVLELLEGAGVELTKVPITFIIYGNDVLFMPSMPTSVNETIEDDNSTVTERVASQIISAIIRAGDVSITTLASDSRVITKFITNLVITVNETIEAQDCVVWKYDQNKGEGFWTKKGCKRMPDDLDLTVCSCNRLGSFAVLIRVRKGSVEEQVALYYITLIGSIISGLALIGCLVTFVSLKSFRSKQPTHIHINLCVSLLAFYIVFLLGPLAVGNTNLCTVASVAIHFFCLATLAWMSAEAMNMYYLFIKVNRTVRHFIPIACLLAYGIPAVCALLVVFLDQSTNFQTADYCFIHPGYALYFGFLAEIGAMFVFNFIIFIWVIRKILCRPLMVSRIDENAKRNEIIKRVRHAILFWFVLGLSWIFGFLAAIDTKTFIFDYLYCIFISIQGILMFLLLCVANPEFRKKFKRLQTDSTPTRASKYTTQTQSTSQLTSDNQSDIPMTSIDNPYETAATE